MSPVVRLMLAAWALVALGCAPLAGDVPERRTSEPHPMVQVGAASTDITPPPGYPMGGLSLNGQRARGFWARLQARAIYIEGDDGLGFALVACDLWSIPSGLSDRTAEIVSQRLGGTPRLGREQVVLGASHTHHSPAVYSTDRFFTSLGASEGGFDIHLLDFLAHRIADAIVGAVQTRRPATISFEQVLVPGATRNRSVEAFAANPEASRVLEESKPPPADLDVGCFTDVACRAVDQRLRALVARRAEGSADLPPIAVAAFLAFHPVSMDKHLAVYSSDLFGAVSRRAERALGNETTVAFFNGAEGDVSATWVKQNRADVRRIASRVSASLVALAKKPSSASLPPAVSIQWEETGLAWRPVEVDGELQGRTALIPMPGRGTVGGAEDGKTTPFPFLNLLSQEGMHGASIGPHGAKVGSADLLQIGGITIPPFWFTRALMLAIPPPSEVAVGVLRVGDVVLVTLPGEFTTVLGHRIARSVAKVSDVPENKVIPIGLAQSYAYYFTTPEEYDGQHYEGSGSFYGKLSGELVRNRLVSLAGRTKSHPGRRHEFEYHHWVPNEVQALHTPWGMREIEKTPRETGRDLDSVFVDVEGDLGDSRSWCWSDVLRDLSSVAPSDGRCGESLKPSCRVIPDVWIEHRAGAEWAALEVAGVRQDDASERILTLAQGSDAGVSMWCAYWIPPAGVDESGRFRFRVRDLRDVERHSHAFEF